MITSLLLLMLAAEQPPTHALDRDAVLAVMRASAPANASLELVDISRIPVPDGDIQFQWKDLTPPPAGQQQSRWRGVVRHDADHVFSIWAVVRIAVPCKRIVAAQNIQRDEPISSDYLHEESYDGFPSESCTADAAAMIGKVAARTISANAPILPVMLTAPAAVKKGEQATAEYHGGAVRLSLSVIVQRNGRVGEVIPVQNPSSHKTLLAEVTGEGKVSIKDMQ